MMQTWNTDTYERNARFVSELGAPVVALLAPREGERVLDLGCGDGALTRRLKQAGCEVVGVDSSPEFVAAARSLGLDARLGNAEHLGFRREFDAVFSNAALHWMTGAENVVRGVAQALKPGGRFVGECGGRGNIAAIVAALEQELTRRGVGPGAANPWYFPAPQDYRSMLEDHGFTVENMELIPRPTALPGDMAAWIETFGQNFTGAPPPGERAAYIADVQERLRPQLCDARGRWTADYVRLRFRAWLRRDSGFTNPPN